MSHLPLVGTHVGLISRDADFSLKNFFVYIGSQNVTVNCLAVPDAFLAHKDYVTALNEYRRIGYSFPGRAEGREAMFRAGITLLEQANNTDNVQEKSALYDQAHEEFRKLHGTPGAPLEYLGKASIYESQGDYEEEAKCFELAFRRYPRHPLLPVLEEQIIYRMHGSSRLHRQATFNFALLALRYIPNIAIMRNTKKLLRSLEKHWEHLPFFADDKLTETSEEIKNLALCLKLSFWLAKPYSMQEILNDLLKCKPFPSITIGNLLYGLIELGSWEHAESKLADLTKNLSAEETANFSHINNMLAIAIKSKSEGLQVAIDLFLQNNPLDFSFESERTLLYLINSAIDSKKTALVHQLYRLHQQWKLSDYAKHQMQCYQIWALLIDRNWTEAGEILHSFSLEELSQDNSLLHFLYGCWLYVTEGKEIAMIHFFGVFEVSYPRTWTLFSYHIKDKIQEGIGWIKKSFLWERRQLYRQLTLFYHCIGDDTRSHHYEMMSQKETVTIK